MARSKKNAARPATSAKAARAAGSASAARAANAAGAVSSARQSKKERRGRGYPRKGLGPIRRWLPSWRFVLGAAFAVVAIGFGALVGMYVTTKIPEPDDFAVAQTTKVYFADGQTEIGTLSEVNRSSVPLEQISETLQHAVISSEDATFYENSGVDLKGIARAFVNNIQGKPRQGGSTLTQQYVERYYTGATISSIPGKIREAMMAIKIDRQQSKEEVLENYLNTIYFGRGSYGIEAAAQAYFGVKAADLNLAQSALLAGIIPAPSAWDPAADPDRAKERFERVLGLMATEGWITEQEAASTQFPEVKEPVQDNAYAGTNGYLLSAARKELIEAGLDETQIEAGGLKIVTSIDPEKQQAASDAVDGLPEDRPENNQVGLVSMDPRNGEIVAMYGGADYLERQRNSATQDHAQGGSTFKAFAVVTAMDKGLSPYDTFDNPAHYQISPDLTYSNVDLRNHGYQTIVNMTANSFNTGFIKLNEEIGPDATRAMAIKLGLPEDTPGLDDGVGNVLGSASPRPVDMVRAFGTIANEGMRSTPHMVREVQDSTGNRIYQGPTETERVIDAETAQLSSFILTSTLRSGGTAASAALPDRIAAGKTGTSSGPMSAWFAGYIPQLVTVVDMYALGPDGGEAVVEPFAGIYQVAGGNFPAQVWHDYMVKATANMEVLRFPDVQRAVTRRGPAVVPQPVPEERVEEEVIPEEEAQPEEEPTPEPSASPGPEQPEPQESPEVTEPTNPQDSPTARPSDRPTNRPTNRPNWTPWWQEDD